MSVVAAFPSKLFPAFQAIVRSVTHNFQITVRNIPSFTCFLAISSRYTHVHTHTHILTLLLRALARAILTIYSECLDVTGAYTTSRVLMCSRRGSFPRAPSRAIGVVWRAYTVCAAIQIKGNRRVWCVPLADPQTKKRRNTPRHVYDGVL